jgi:hypothetical protein
MLAPPFAFLVGSNPTAGSHRLTRRRRVPILGLPCEGSEAEVRGCASVCFFDPKSRDRERALHSPPVSSCSRRLVSGSAP